MAWRAYIEGVQDNPTPSDNIFVNIVFRDAVSTPPREMRKQYKYVSGTLRADFERMVIVERDNMRALDQAKTVINNAIGSEIT